MAANWGTGRRDYSLSVEESTEPVISSWQSNATVLKTFTVAANTQETITIPFTFATGAANHNINKFIISVDANVLIGVELWTSTTSWALLTEFGYQTVEIDTPMTLPLSELILKVYNYSNIAVNGVYSHCGVQGKSSIMSRTVGEYYVPV
jgi:hypothetical protein